MLLLLISSFILERRGSFLCGNANADEILLFEKKAVHEVISYLFDLHGHNNAIMPGIAKNEVAESR